MGPSKRPRPRSRRWSRLTPWCDTTTGGKAPTPTPGWLAPEIPAREPGATDRAPLHRRTPTAPRAGRPPVRPAPARSTIGSSTRSAWPTTLPVGQGRSHGPGPSARPRSSRPEPPASLDPREATASAPGGFPAIRSGSRSLPCSRSPRRGSGRRRPRLEPGLRRRGLPPRTVLGPSWHG